MLQGRAALCLLLVCTVATAVTEAEASGQHRRGSALDRLKHRSASARWDELRKVWQFNSRDNNSTPANSETGPQESVTPAGSATLDSAAGDHSADKGINSAWGTEVTSPVLMEEDASFFPSSEAGSAQGVGLPSLPAAAPEAQRALPVQQTESVWQLAQDSEEDSGDGSAIAKNILPKPITDILPYYDYSPDGQDPCEFLCPRPELCQKEDGSKPCPEAVDLPDIPYAGRESLPTHVMWEPSNLFHNPLYFEDHALERYGHTHSFVLQPLVSVGKFGTQLVGLPYQMALHQPCEHQYTLGWHRPGECVPYRYHLPPWNTKAAVTAGAVYTGLIFLIP